MTDKPDGNTTEDDAKTERMGVGDDTEVDDGSWPQPAVARREP